MDRKALKLEWFDLEVFKVMFCYCGTDKSGAMYKYEISCRMNQLDGLIKHLKDSDIDYWVAYNGTNYDSQILQYILDNYDMWYDRSWLEIVHLIRQFSDECISRTKFEQQPVYREWKMDIKVLDPFRIAHYDNKNRRVGLKQLEFSMDMPNIQEIPIDHRKEELTIDEVQMVIDYCWNDVDSLERFWNTLCGDTDNNQYMGEDMVQIRLDVIEEMGFRWSAINWSNSKMGDEINKKGYMEETGCTYDDLYNKKRNRKPTPKFTYGSCIPKYVKFRSEVMNNLYKRVKDVIVSLSKEDKQEFVVTYGKTTYSIMRGGIHSHDSCRILETTTDKLLKDADIGGQYPRTIVKRELYPSHLGRSWLVMYDKQGQRRTGYKDKKHIPKYNGLQKAWKEVLNAGGYGQTNQTDNWQYDPTVMYRCTIGNEFEILMLIEWLEDAGIEVVSANTDGLVCLIPVELEGRYYELCDKWEKVVGNDVVGKLEFTNYQKLIQRDVNNYLAITEGGKIKTKGVFEIDKLLHKNKSKRVVPKALKAWFVDGIKPEEYIAGNENIYDYVIGKKASDKYSYKGIDRHNGDTSEYDQIVRYIVTTKGEKLWKVAKEGSDAKVKQAKCESKEDHQLLVNRIPEYNKLDDLFINRKYYIDEVYKIVGQIEPAVLRDKKTADKKQLSMF